MYLLHLWLYKVFLQTEFVGDKLKSLDGYKQIADKNAWDLAPYLFNLCQ